MWVRLQSNINVTQWLRVELKVFCRLGSTGLNSNKGGIVYCCVLILLHLLASSTLHLHWDIHLCHCINDVNCNFKDGTPTSKTFEHVTSEIGAEEAEEVGVEHLLRWKLNLRNTAHPSIYRTHLFGCNNACFCVYRDIKDTTVGTLSQRITNQVHGLKGLNSKLLDIRSYLERVAAGKLPINHQIIYQLQDVFNLLPDVNLLVCCHGIWGILGVLQQYSPENQWSFFTIS